MEGERRYGVTGVTGRYGDMRYGPMPFRSAVFMYDVIDLMFAA
jgi:hypothetical protein